VFYIVVTIDACILGLRPLITLE